MDNQEVNEILKAAQSYLLRLKLLDEELEQAMKQINQTFEDTVKSIAGTFLSLRETVVNILKERETFLLNQAQKTKSQGLEPLEECQKLISRKIELTETLINGGQAVLYDNNEEFNKLSNNANFLGNLPEIPDLKDVPFLTFCYEPSTETEIKNILSDFGQVCPIAPVQIINFVENPGAIQVEWEVSDNDERVADIQEFRLQRAFGNVLKEKHLFVNFKDCYRGLETQFLVKDVQPCQCYSFRVCCKFEGSSEWSPWSLPQVSSTSLEPFSWKPNEDFILTNEGKIAKPLKTKTSILISSGTQFSVGHCIEFTFLEVDNTDAIIGLITEDIHNKVTDLRLAKEYAFLLSRTGKISIDGEEKSTKMPLFVNGLKVCFACTKVNNDKIRINIDCADKRVTYDWFVPPTQQLLFASQFDSVNWKIMIE